jgi:hypothetical protein
MKILYITNLTNSNICEFTLKPHRYVYYYGLIKILGRENVKLTNINSITSHINTIEEFDYILITRDLLLNFYIRIAIENIIMSRLFYVSFWEQEKFGGIGLIYYSIL